MYYHPIPPRKINNVAQELITIIIILSILSGIGYYLFHAPSISDLFICSGKMLPWEVLRCSIIEYRFQ